jgi:2-polyprenyl-6-methoxyphenol hydroxylase-like FAD-dependent oxidoreductase
MSASTTRPIIIAGAGVTGLVLAQHLKKLGIEFLIFERDESLTYRGVGWGLTLNWSLPALKDLLPEDLVRRLPEAYVDRAAVERGEVSRFPFFDLSTGVLKASTPDAPQSKRVRVTRQRFRGLLTTGIDVQWGKGVRDFVTGPDSVTVTFDDGTECVGCLLIGCDGGNSRVRKVLFPDSCANYRIPVGVLGMRVSFTAEQIAGMRALDKFFLQGTASKNDTFCYFARESLRSTLCSSSSTISC